MHEELSIVNGPGSVAIGDVCRFLVMEAPGAEQSEVVRIMDLRKVSDGVHFQGIVETEGALSVINVEGVYDPKTSAGTLRYEA